MLLMTPTSLFLDRRLELLWSAMEKILQKTPCSVAMVSSDPSAHFWLNDAYDRAGTYNFGRAFRNVATAQEALG
jgi:hypothetical protein